MIRFCKSGFETLSEAKELVGFDTLSEAKEVVSIPLGGKGSGFETL